MWWPLLLVSRIIFAKTAYVTDDPTSIINGDLAHIEDYPFYVYLRHDDESLLCGGSLIQPNIVLTAAHCLGKVAFTVYVGITSEDDLKEAETYEVADFLIHPRFSTFKKRHDIGLIRLNRNVVYGPKVQPIELADFKPPVDEQVTVIGFGKVVCDVFYNWETQCQNPVSTHLRKGIMNVTSTDKGVIRVVSDTQVACYGDSGGPMIYDDQLVGVASRVNTYECTRGNKYVPVNKYISWIQEYIEASKSVTTTENSDYTTTGASLNATTGNANTTTEEPHPLTTEKSYVTTTQSIHSSTGTQYDPVEILHNANTTEVPYPLTTEESYVTTESIYNARENEYDAAEILYKATENTYAAEILAMQEEIRLIQLKIFIIQQKMYILEQNIKEDYNHDLE